MVQLHVGEAEVEPDWQTVAVAAFSLFLSAVVVVLATRLRRLERLLEGSSCNDNHVALTKPFAPSHALSPASKVPTSADDVQCLFKCSASGGHSALAGVPRPLSTVLRQRVSVLDFGGKNDGTTDCTNAIQQAINVARCRNGGVDIFFPAGGYLVTKTLRVTDLAGGGVTFTGEGNGIAEFGVPPAVLTGAGSCIIGRTGGVVFDCAGSQFLTFRRLVIQSSGQGHSTCGLLFARTQASEFVQFNKIEDVVIDLASDPSANSGKGTIACYMIAAELTTIRNVYFLADTALANVVSNEYQIHPMKS